IRFTLRRSPSLTSVAVPRWRLRFLALELSMWRSPECPRFTLPLAVFLKRLDAPLCDFNFGISPRNQLPAASCQPSAGNSILLSIALESSARRGQSRRTLSLRNWIRNLGHRSRRLLLLFFFLRQLLLLLR